MTAEGGRQNDEQDSAVSLSPSALFAEAERMQAESQPQFPLLYSLAGFRYADLILAPADRAAWRCLLLGTDILPVIHPQRGAGVLPGVAADHHRLEARATALAACTAAERRATQTLEWVSKAGMDLLSAALDHLTLARASLYRAILESQIAAEPGADETQADASRTKARRHKDQDETESLRAGVASCEPSALHAAATHLNQAHDGLCQAGAMHHIPRGLLMASLLAAVWRAVGPVPTGRSDSTGPGPTGRLAACPDTY